MGSSQDFIDFVIDQIDSRWQMSYRKMFGEYMLYAKSKPILLVCDETVYVKKLPQLEELLHDAPKGIPYPNAREHHILDIEDREMLNEVVAILEAITPLPKPKKPKS